MVADDDISTRRVRTFLRTGHLPAGRRPADMARACDMLIRRQTQKSLPAAVELAGLFVKQSRRQPEMPLQMALRSHAWTLHCSGKYLRAKDRYLEARQLVTGDAALRARVDRILIDVYMYLGDFDSARRHAQMAIRTFGRMGRPDEQAKTRINYGNLFHRQDRHREACSQYQLARKVLETDPDKNALVLGLCYYNLANTQVQIFDMKAARNLYEKARDLFDNLGYGLYANECDYGLAWMYMLIGDYQIALPLLASCEQIYKKASHAKGVMLCLLDRAEAFLALNLFDDAYDAARDAGSMAKRLGIGYELSKAAFFQARSARALGKTREAASFLEIALRGFRQTGNRGFEAAVRLFKTQTGADNGSSKEKLGEIRGLFRRSQLPLWEAICDLELMTRWPNDASIKKRLRRNPAVLSVPHLYAQWQTQLGDDAAGRGRNSQAIAHWERAVEALEGVRAGLPPVELRGAYLRGRTDPYRRIISDKLDHQPGQAAVWVDRFKTAGAWAADSDAFQAGHIRDKARRSLAELAGQVAALAGKVTTVSGTRGVAARSAPALRHMQRQVRNHLAAVTGEGTSRRLRSRAIARDLTVASRRYPVVQLYQHEENIFALVHEQGSTRVVPYRDGAGRARELYGIWQILINRQLLSGGRPRKADLTEEKALFEHYGRWLWDPLEIASETERLLIVPDGILTNIPYAAIISRGESLSERHRILMSPTIQHHSFASRLRTQSRRVGVFAGGGRGLRYTHEELRSFASGLSADIYNPCTRADWPEKGDWWIWHFTGHARLRSDNPFYSSLSLADGPLFGADFRTKQCRVELVTLAACRTAHHSVVPGEEATGLVRCLIEMGARNVVGSHWAVRDKSAAFWMREFYRSVLDGVDAVSAVREAALRTRDKFPSVYDWSAFSIYGAG